MQNQKMLFKLSLVTLTLQTITTYNRIKVSPIQKEIEKASHQRSQNTAAKVFRVLQKYLESSTCIVY